jgi:hypothetical protein
MTAILTKPARANQSGTDLVDKKTSIHGNYDKATLINYNKVQIMAACQQLINGTTEKRRPIDQYVAFAPSKHKSKAGELMTYQ